MPFEFVQREVGEGSLQRNVQPECGNLTRANHLSCTRATNQAKLPSALSLLPSQEFI